MIGLIDSEGYETPEFTERVNRLVKIMLDQRRAMPDIGDFLVPTVITAEGKISYWGILDLAIMPEEDAYIEAAARFYSAVQCLHEHNIMDFGLVNMSSVIGRNPFPKAPPMGPFPS